MADTLDSPVSARTVKNLFQWFAGKTDARYIQEAVDASKDTKGGVKVGEGLGMDGAAIKVKAGKGLGFNSEDGALKVTLTGGSGADYELPVASEDNLGGIRPGEGVSIRAPYLDLKPATDNVLGGIKIGEGLTMDGGNRLSVVKGATIPSATATTTGGVKIGDNSGLEMREGFLHVTLTPGGNNTIVNDLEQGDGIKIDSKYINLRYATKEAIGGIIVGEGLDMDIEGKLHVEPATSTKIGGVKVVAGRGLSIDDDGVLTCIAGGSASYSDFVRATAFSNGKSGLVPAPLAGDQNKFLGADGAWHTINQYSSGGLSYGSLGDQDVLWVDAVDGVPCLKFRHGDYDYNFHGTANLVGSAAPPIDNTVDTSNKTAVYKLSQSPSTVTGGIWYELQNDKPTIKLRQYNYEFAFNYNSVTYLGSQTTGLVSYVPCDYYYWNPIESLGSFEDNVLTSKGQATLVGGSSDKSSIANIIVAENTNYAPLYQTGRATAERPATPLIGSAFTARKSQLQAGFKMSYPSSILPIKVTPKGANEYTTDFWFFFSDAGVDRIEKNGGSLDIGDRIAIQRSGSTAYFYVKLKVSNGSTSNYLVDGVQYTNPITLKAIDYANKRHHLAITCKPKDGKIITSVALNGEFIIRVNTTSANYYIFEPNKLYYLSEYTAFNKVRWFNRVFWDSNFQKPEATAYYL